MPLNPRCELWIIAGAEATSISKSIVARVSPDVVFTIIDVNDILLEQFSPSFVRATKGISEQLEFEELGQLRIDSELNIHSF